MSGLDLLELFRQDGHELVKQGREYVTLCPFHTEKTPSCTIEVEVDRPFWHCFGCHAHGDAVQYLVQYRKMNMREALDMRDAAEGKRPGTAGKGQRRQQKAESGQQKPASTQRKPAEFIEKLPDNHFGRYVYCDAKGRVRFVVQRYVIEGKKTFGQYTRAKKGETLGWLKELRMEKDRPLYRLAEVLKAPTERQIMVVEGEKCAEAVAGASRKALPVCWAGGTASWRKTDWTPLYGRPVLLVADGDKGGHKCMQEIAEHLHPRCPDIMLVLPPLPEKGKKARDIADEIESGTDINKWLREHGDIYNPDQQDEVREESSVANPSDDTDDEWGDLIAAAQERVGSIFEGETPSNLAALKRDRLVSRPRIE